MNTILKESSCFEHITLNPIHQWKNKKKTSVSKDIGFSLISTKDKIIIAERDQKSGDIDSLKGYYYCPGKLGDQLI